MNDTLLNEFNGAIDGLLVHDVASNSLHPRVCLVCDKFLTNTDYRTMRLKTFMKYVPYLRGADSIPTSLRQQYCCSFVTESTAVNALLAQCLLSPRSSLVKHSSKDRRLHSSIMCCATCHGGLKLDKLRDKGTLPRFAIANDLAIGKAPPCLEILNDVELALISQARFKGHLFAFWGGCHKSIKGWHSLYEVDVEHTAAVLDQVAELTKLNNIAVVLTGPFTRQQKSKILDKVIVNIDNVKAAFKWLQENNRLYSNMSFDTTTIRTPIIIDNSNEIEGENTDIELKEEIQVVFPDGTIHTAGCTDKANFEKTLADLRATYPEATPYLTSRPSRAVLREYENMNLMRAFPKQFPFGYGYHSLFNHECSANGFLQHLQYLSIPSFHEATFVLVIHNMFERSKALTSSMWQVRGREKCDVSEQDLNTAISRKLKGLHLSMVLANHFSILLRL